MTLNLLLLAITFTIFLEIEFDFIFYVPYRSEKISPDRGTRLSWIQISSQLLPALSLPSPCLLSVAMIVVKDRGSRTRIKDYKGSTKMFLNRSRWRIKSQTICSLFDQLQFHRFAKMPCFWHCDHFVVVVGQLPICSRLPTSSESFVQIS